MNANPAAFTLPFSHYAQLGYSPCPTNGKVPSAGRGWYQRQYDAAALKALDQSGQNVGLRCSNVIGLDIDVPDAALAKKIEALCRKLLKLPKSTPRRIGHAPKALLVARTSSPLRGFDIAHKSGSKWVTLFQVLGAGKQFVIHGIHPDTHKPYTLSAPLPKWGQLQEVSAAQLSELRTALLALLRAEGYAPRGGLPGTAEPGHGGFSDAAPWSATGMAQAAQALAGLDPDMARADWIAVGMAVHDGSHGSAAGFELWDVWSQGSPKYQPRACAASWRSYKPGTVTKATLFKNDYPKRAVAPHTPARLNAPTPPASGVGFDISELTAHDPGAVPWIVQDILTHGAHLLVGRPKGGKSWVTMDMAFACINGSTFLSKQATKCGVLWIASEDTKDSLARRIRLRKEAARGATVMTMESIGAERAQWDAETSFDGWLREYLTAHPDVGLVIMDTLESCVAKWQEEQIDQKRAASVTQVAYQKSRVFEAIGLEFGCCIVLVTHTRKRNGKEVTDYHELVNEAQTIVAGAAASLVLADPPDRDPHDEDDHRRVFAIRGRNIVREATLLIELKDARARLLGAYREVVQSEAQAETMQMLEALLAETEPDAKGERWVTLKQLAAALGKHVNTIGKHFEGMKKDPAKMLWKGRRVELRQNRGVRLVPK